MGRERRHTLGDGCIPVRAVELLDMKCHRASDVSRCWVVICRDFGYHRDGENFGVMDGISS
jgi:hypothetical protein